MAVTKYLDRLNPYKILKGVSWPRGLFTIIPREEVTSWGKGKLQGFHGNVTES
jgi:hypothetical protein